MDSSKEYTELAEAVQQLLKAHAVGGDLWWEESCVISAAIALVNKGQQNEQNELHE